MSPVADEESPRAWAIKVMDLTARVLLVVLIVIMSTADVVASARSTEADLRSAAVWSAFGWMVDQGRHPDVVAEYGSDFMEFHYELATSAKDPRLRARALVEGRDVSRRYVAGLHPATSSGEAIDIISAQALLHEFGLRSDRLRKFSDSASRLFSFADLYSLEPGMVPEDADELCDAIICLHFARRAQLPDGEALEWALSMASRVRYSDAADLTGDQLIDQDNLASHIVYVMSDYGRLSLSECDMTDEREYMLAEIPRLVFTEDVEMVSEFVDSLRIMGVDDDDPVMAYALAWLLGVQNADGSFGDPNAEDFYDRYHSTWTALNALRRFTFQGQGPRWPAPQCAD